MDRNKSILVLTFIIAIFIISFVLGYQLIRKEWNDKNLNNINKISDKEKNGDVEILKEENIITPNTFIEKRVHYKECDHTITSLDIADKEIINMDKEKYEEYLKFNYPNFKLVSYSNTKIVIFGEKAYLCEEHFIIGELDGYLSIFKIGEDGEKILFKNFKDYPLSMLTETDQDNLRKGIVVDSEDELSDVLENFIS